MFLVVFGVAAALAACGGAGDDDSPSEVRSRIVSLRQSGDLERAIVETKIALRERPDDAGLRALLGELYLDVGDGSAAESNFQRAIETRGVTPRLRRQLARALMLQRRFESVLELLSVESIAGDGQLLLLRGKAELEVPFLDPAQIRRTFLDLYGVLSEPDRADEGLAAELARLREQHPAVEAAAQHFACRLAPTKPHPVAEPQQTEMDRNTRILRVGPRRELEVPSMAARVARDGDIIEIEAGVYRNDVAVWRQSNLVLRAVGGRAHMLSDGRTAEDKGIWLFEGDDNTVEHIEFSGARSRHHNGSGIRLHGSGLTVRHSHFHDNETGILGGRGPESDVLIEYSEFGHNGYGDGLSHNIYMGAARSFVLRYSYSHHARVGHLVKSRAHTNFILYNRLMDEEDGSSSYVIDLPDGGRAYILGNELQQGHLSENAIMVSFAAENSAGDRNELYVVHNTFYNRMFEGVFVRNASESPAHLINNLFAGAEGQMLDGPGELQGNLHHPMLGLAAAAAYDYALTPQSPALDAGVELPPMDGFDLQPTAEYVHPRQWKPRQEVWTRDVGAHEFCGL